MHIIINFLQRKYASDVDFRFFEELKTSESVIQKWDLHLYRSVDLETKLLSRNCSIVIRLFKAGIKRSKSDERSDLRNATDGSKKCERALTDAKKDNDFIYHERVPDEKNLAPITKGQLISKCPFLYLQISQKPNIFFLKFSALASKKRSNPKSSVRESK